MCSKKFTVSSDNLICSGCGRIIYAGTEYMIDADGVLDEDYFCTDCACSVIKSTLEGMFREQSDDLTMIDVVNDFDEDDDSLEVLDSDDFDINFVKL